MICVPIVAKTTEEAVAQMARSAALADILELRIDQIADVDLPRLMGAREDGTLVLVTNRRRDEGGGFSGTERERVRLLLDAVTLGADYVDIEARTERPLLKEFMTQIAKHDHRTQWIISMHDFSGTPSERTLHKRFNACRKLGADIVKIVTHAHTVEDNLKTLGLIPYARERNQAIIALCMGEQGKISRIIAPLLGSLLSYASLDKGAESAFGQLTVAEMQQIYQILQPS
jgi:3-dehydroquinate dehydratase type I